MFKRSLLFILINSCAMPLTVTQQPDGSVPEVAQSAGTLDFSFDNESMEYDAICEDVVPPKPGPFKRHMQLCGSTIITWFFSFSQMVSTQYNRFKKWVRRSHHTKPVEDNEETKQ